MKTASKISMNVQDHGLRYDQAVTILTSKSFSSKACRQALEQMRRLAEEGYERAQCDLGIMYYLGLGLEQSCAEAAKCFHLAAYNGYFKAQEILGFIYENGIGVERDCGEAARWHQLAKQNQCAPVQLRIWYLEISKIGDLDDAHIHRKLLSRQAGSWS